MPEDGAAGESSDAAEDETGVPPDMLSDADKSEIDALPGELEQIANAAVAWFEASDLPHRCPHHPSVPEGHSSYFTPDLSMNCNAGPDQRCVPWPNGGGVGYYPSHLWTDNQIWFELGFEKTTPHAFHYLFEATNELDGYGACTFTVQAKGDLDDDGMFSAYTILGSIDANGAVIEPLMIVDPYE